MSESRAKKKNIKSGIGVIFKKIPITPKIIALTVLMSFVLWLALDNVQGPYIKRVFDNFLIKHLNEMAMDARVRFDNHVGLYNQAARLIVSQKNFYDYVSSGKGSRDGKSGIKHYRELPEWLPDASVMRKFVQVRYAFLMDSAGNIMEAYNGGHGSVPDTLLNTPDMLRKLSHNQSFMTLIDGRPFLLTSEFIKDTAGRTLAGIMIANPLDGDFLTASQGGAGGANITALVTMDNPRIIASNRPDILPEGAAFKDIEREYVVTGKSFFDWGASDLIVQLLSFMPKKEFDEMSKSIITVTRLMRLVITVILVASFVVISYYFSRHIRMLTESIVGFSKYALGIERTASPKGDEILILEDQFRTFTEEIIESRERLKRQAEELLREKTVYLDNILHSVNVAVAAVDSDFRIKYYNPMAEKIFGYKASEVIGKTVMDIHTKEKVDNARFERAIEIVRKEGQYKYFVEQKKGEETKWIDSTVTGVYDNDNNLVGFVLISEDVSERKRYEDELKIKNQQLEEALADVKALSGLLPICASCKKIRDDQGYWNHLESYISAHSEAEFSHSICPECVKKLYPEYYIEMQKKKEENKNES
ncbi:MAG TPA: hypothetical protein DHV16_03660 [Nitrospiraceae bacterium]|nr:MAG: hypothetical protein A2Z82_04945 [Nitrospirae bacterium GWA2_46_11]OGW25352.1 MAG: hypothetical protein A2X55_00605 [Nitrospirae bacterium GWB2_47_37]HAK87867.1 hypothetical protein [Nitrospiraceae bacterium]HCZ11354.1 hypothetical protein [Nitrospiraceae bacterium]